MKIYEFIQNSMQELNLPIHYAVILVRNSEYGKDIVRRMKSAKPFSDLKPHFFYSRNYDPQYDGLKVVNIYTAKGLDYPIVVIPRLDQFPYHERGDSVNIEDHVEILNRERNMFFVATTRAMNKLLVLTTEDPCDHYLDTDSGSFANDVIDEEFWNIHYNGDADPASHFLDIISKIKNNKFTPIDNPPDFSHIPPPDFTDSRSIKFLLDKEPSEHEKKLREAWRKTTLSILNELFEGKENKQEIIGPLTEAATQAADSANKFKEALSRLEEEEKLKDDDRDALLHAEEPLYDDDDDDEAITEPGDPYDDPSASEEDGYDDYLDTFDELDEEDEEPQEPFSAENEVEELRGTQKEYGDPYDDAPEEDGYDDTEY